MRRRPIAARAPACPGAAGRRGAGADHRRGRRDPAGQPLALVFKTVADPYVGKISLFKVVSGTVRPDAVLFNPRSRAEERLHALFTLRGKEQLPETEIPAGRYRGGGQTGGDQYRRHADAAQQARHPGQARLARLRRAGGR